MDGNRLDVAVINVVPLNLRQVPAQARDGYMLDALLWPDDGSRPGGEDSHGTTIDVIPDKIATMSHSINSRIRP